LTGRKLTGLAVVLNRISLRAKPAFLIIGAQKCGTSALHTHLAKHPQIVPGCQKEIHFFDQEAHYQKGAIWYHLHFPSLEGLNPGTIAFEATPHYLYAPGTAERIHRYDPHMQLIVLLRNPIERAYSAWNMFYRLFHSREVAAVLKAITRTGQANDVVLARLFSQINPQTQADLVNLFLSDGFDSFDTAVRQEIAQITTGNAPFYPDYVQRGLYYEQLYRYFNTFDHQQILVLDSQELRSQPADVLAGITRFLDLPDHDWRRVDLTSGRSRYDQSMSRETRELLADFYRPHNQRLYDLLGRHFGWD
jgi:hypothetical protein